MMSETDKANSEIRDGDLLGAEAAEAHDASSEETPVAKQPEPASQTPVAGQSSSSEAPAVSQSSEIPATSEPSPSNETPATSEPSPSSETPATSELTTPPEAPPPGNGAATTSQLKRRTKKKSGIMRLLLFAWLPISFVLPCLLTYDVAVQQYVEIPGRSKFTKDPDFRKAEDAQNQAVRSGAIGALVAILIFALWQLDSFNRKDNDLKERWAKVVVVALA